MKHISYDEILTEFCAEVFIDFVQLEKCHINFDTCTTFLNIFSDVVKYHNMIIIILPYYDDHNMDSGFAQ